MMIASHPRRLRSMALPCVLMTLSFLLGGCPPEDEPPESLSDCAGAPPSDPYDLGALAITGDTLTATISYSGGCETHDFVLCWPDQSFLESNPVQVNLDIWHDDHDDPCDAYPTEDVDFDLVPLEQAWQDAYGGTTGTILINLGGQQIAYDF